MDLKTSVVDTLDPRPIKKVTTYAFGTMLEGFALGLWVTVCVPNMSVAYRCIIAVVCFLLGAVLAVSSYSVLKRRYQIMEIVDGPETKERMAGQSAP